MHSDFQRLLTTLLIATLVASAAQPQLVRKYTGDYTHLEQLSKDGQLLLTSGYSLCPPKGIQCNSDVLAVYRVSTGKLINRLVSTPNGSFQNAHFADDGSVRALEYKLVTTPGRSESHTSMAWIRWEPASGLKHYEMDFVVADFEAVCWLEPDGGIGHDSRKALEGNQLPVKIMDRGGRVRDFGPTADAEDLGVLGQNCRDRRVSKSPLLDRFLLAHGDTLQWLNSASAKPLSCKTFLGEWIYGAAVSQDGSLITAITSPEPKYIPGLTLQSRGPFGNPTWRLTILNGASCDVLRQFPISLPNAKVLKEDFASQMTISADNTKLAICYGRMQDHGTTAYYGVYAMADGRSLITLRGDSSKPSLMQTLRGYNPEYNTPINGALQFTPDSAHLFATSNFLREWDLSSVR